MACPLQSDLVIFPRTDGERGPEHALPERRSVRQRLQWHRCNLAAAREMDVITIQLHGAGRLAEGISQKAKERALLQSNQCFAALALGTCCPGPLRPQVASSATLPQCVAHASLKFRRMSSASPRRYREPTEAPEASCQCVFGDRSDHGLVAEDRCHKGRYQTDPRQQAKT
jgi:hypothetical protein